MSQQKYEVWQDGFKDGASQLFWDIVELLDKFIEQKGWDDLNNAARDFRLDRHLFEIALDYGIRSQNSKEKLFKEFFEQD